MSEMSEMSALKAIARATGPIADATTLSTAAAAELLALPADRRVDAAKRANLPAHARFLAREAGPLLAVLIEDDALRAKLGDRAVSLWLTLDRHACVAVALAFSEQWRPKTLFALLGEVDRSEAFELLAPVYRLSRKVRVELPKQPALLADARFVALALERAAADPRAACRLLAGQGSAPAVAELRGMVERAEQLDETLMSAVEGLEFCLEKEEFVSLLATLLLRSFAADVVHSRLASKLSTHHRQLLGFFPSRPNLQEILKACAQKSVFVIG